MQNDVTAAGIEMSTLEGFESIEHVKRYTALGFGTDQGKTGNVNGMAIVAKCLGQSIEQTGTTVFRPNYNPVSFGVVAGANTDELFDPQRFTPMHEWHLENGAEFENVGQWKRPLYYTTTGESLKEAIHREQLATRKGVGILDASTLGKIDIQGKDAREFLGRVYTNAWAKLAPGRCRYGLMCGEDGMVMDDGVTSCLGENHFLMTTTSGGAARVLSWLEIYHQTEWPEMEVFFRLKLICQLKHSVLWIGEQPMSLAFLPVYLESLLPVIYRTRLTFQHSTDCMFGALCLRLVKPSI